jgi:phage terminase Nu1 subunit (DNA packaging protein)
MTDLDATCTQAAFGELVGITQQAVSDLLARDVVTPGQTAGQWLIDYCAHLREQAAGRGADGELAYQRSELARVSRERNQIKLDVERREYAAVSLLEQVLATVGRSIAGVLEPLHVNLHKRCPALTPEDLKLIQLEVSKACDIAVNASLAVLDVAEEDAQQGADGQEELAIIEGDDE